MNQHSQLHLDIALLQDKLGYIFTNPLLLEQALTHRSHSGIHNERLEFLGDSILNCVVALMLYERFTKIDEGDLSRLRANLVKQQSLYEIAQRLELSPFLRLGEGELKSGGFRRPSILADTMEALFGAIFIDGGFDQTKKVISTLYQPVLQTVDPKTLGKDAKTLLQEYLQSRHIALPVYTVVATHGAAHNQVFEIECAVPKFNIQVTARGGSRRAGEQSAAKLALEAVIAAAPQAAKRTRRSKSKAAAENSEKLAKQNLGKNSEKNMDKNSEYMDGVKKVVKKMASEANNEHTVMESEPIQASLISPQSS